ncbi:MAG: cation diffusion facilitator family transporter [Nitrospirota bacterium]|nr:cation diffusion facilitator family transporter [Nitrospirota bacterium]
MAASGSTRVVLAALAGNLLIAISKFGAAAHTGSSAMLSESIHSLVDTGNQWLLLYGMRRAKQPPDATHPFGYGMEVYFWTFVVSILVFALGAGISIYEGIDRITHPHPVGDPTINYVVLGVAMLFEATAWWVAYREFNRSRGTLSLLAAVRRSKDPTVFTVLFEDSAAMLGLLVAFLAVWTAHNFDMPILDGIASVLIGLILAVTAAVLAYESKGLLIGEAAHPEEVEMIRKLAIADPRIDGVNAVLTMHMGPDDVLLNLSLDFADHLSAGELEQTIVELSERIRANNRQIKRVFIEAREGGPITPHVVNGEIG